MNSVANRQYSRSRQPTRGKLLLFPGVERQRSREEARAPLLLGDGVVTCERALGGLSAEIEPEDIEGPLQRLLRVTEALQAKLERAQLGVMNQDAAKGKAK